MTVKLPILATGSGDCWNRIGVWGDHSCPQLATVTHCHNCPVFSAAGRRFLDAPSPPGYLDEWTARLADHEAEVESDAFSVLLFRLRDEWLALPVSALVEVTLARTIHRIPHRGGLLAGMVNIRGEIHLCMKLDLLLGLPAASTDANASHSRLLVIRKESETWAFAVDEVDRVHRLTASDVSPPPATVSRSTGRLTRGVWHTTDRSAGLIDEDRLFHALRERVR